MGGEDHAGHVGQDEEEGRHQPGQNQPAGVLGRAVHQHHAKKRNEVNLTLPFRCLTFHVAIFQDSLFFLGIMITLNRYFCTGVLKTTNWLILGTPCIPSVC